MIDEVVEALALTPESRILDCNLGGGGHCEAILTRLQGQGQVIGIDCDAEALQFAQERLEKWPNFRCYRVNFGSLQDPLEGPAQEILSGGFTGILMDLGVSSAQLNRAHRGFSFRWDAQLDMRMDDRTSTTAADLLREADERELTRIFREYGEEPRARQIAHRIIQERLRHPLSTTGQLADLVKSVTGQGSRHHHPATQVFQALRIAINDELGNLDRGLRSLLELLAAGGRWAVLSYHSLEDRRIKTFFREQLGRCVCPRDWPVCQCHPQARLKIPSGGSRTASAEEIARNPRARSVRLRIATKVDNQKEQACESN